MAINKECSPFLASREGGRGDRLAVLKGLNIWKKSLFLAMKKLLLLLVFSWLTLALLAVDSGDAVRAAQGLVSRLLPDFAEDFVFELIDSDDGHDVFEISSGGGKIVIGGNKGVAMAIGLNWYLKYFCKCNVSWCGDNLNLPEILPLVSEKIRKVTWTKNRYFLNYCCFGYSLPWWNWDQWEQLIDWMALNGINAPLSVTGQEATWQAVCKRLGLSDEQIREFLAGPPYLPFGWMGCLDGWGGPLPQSWIDSHEILGKQILAREREFGMTPVQQGFTGHVPAAVKEKFPDAKLHTINWVEWTTHLVDPLDPLFQKIADIFLEEQKKRFGSDHYYAADSFIEMDPPSGDLKYLNDMSKAIYKGMTASDPEAVWVLQTWIFHYKKQFWTQPRIKTFLDAVDDENMLCLDLFCEDNPQWSQTQSFYGKQWLWCNVQNFGCSVNLGAALERNNSGLMDARQNPEKGKLAGLGFVNEGLGYNPVTYDLMYEMAWRDETVDMAEWINGYSEYRYGQTNADAEHAWNILMNTVYTGPNRTRSVINRYPTMRKPRELPYSNSLLAEGWESLLKSSDNLKEIDTYKFDLVNITRQVLSNHAVVLQGKIVEAYDAKDIDKFEKSSTDFLDLMDDIDELLATREEFLLGSCLEDAKRWGENDQEKAILEWNARRVLTLWGSTKLNDYASKEWSGLISGYYHVRWKWYLDELSKALRAGKEFDNDKFQEELRKWMYEWSDARETYPDEPVGNSVEISKRLWDKYGGSLS